MYNKNILLSIVVIAMFVLSTGLVWAGDETPIDAPGSVATWQQFPDMKYGVNIQSTEVEPIVADDWRCEDPRPVTDVHFWGSYIGWETKNETPQSHPPGVIGFVIRIYEDVPAGVDQNYSHPGKLLHEEKVVEFGENYVATILHPDETYEHKFYYGMDLPEPFEQKGGTIYWISIAAIMPDEYTYPWGWETSTRHWNDNACGSVSGGEPWDWDEITPGMLPQWYPHETVDMAFEITVRPESPPIKWQQRPDMVQGVNVISLVDDNNPESMAVADDWLCLDGSPVTDLHFWGSYPGWYPDKVPRDPNTPPGIRDFRVRIYSDVPVVVSGEGFSRPGNLLYEVWVDDFAETYVNSILLPWDKYEHKYGYDMNLPKPFAQERGTIYWVSIAARPLNHTHPWGWESSMDRWNDFAVRGWYADPNTSEWDLIYHSRTESPIDMAFKLTTGEGPMKWLQFPDMADGVNILSLPMNPVVADDWLCTDGKPITEVHFWGSYLSRDKEIHWEQENPGPPEKTLPPPPGISEFKFSFHKDVPAGNDPDMPWSHPGEPLHEVWATPDEVKERYWDSIPHTGVDGTIWWEHKFYYIAPLKEPFKQEKGTVYWLDIGAEPADDEWYWGWETSLNHWNDNAVRGWENGSSWECIGAAPIDFEDLTLGAEYNVGDTFTTSGVPVTVKQFRQSDGTWYLDGHTTVGNDGYAGGSGAEMNINNVNLDFGFGAPHKSLSLLFCAYGGGLNIEINGDIRNFDEFSEINGLTIDGVNVTVVDLGDSKGHLTLDGIIEQFSIGGQEFLIDDVRFAKRVDMAFALMTETETPGVDWGDAPDSTNSFSASMTAYQGVSANFPTAYLAGSPPHGPIHRQPKALAFLGQRVSLESEADIGHDEDGVNNIKPLNDTANLDGADDGVSLPLVLAHCEPNTFDYVVTVVNPLHQSVYVNVWFDWNRDGDWDDVMKCPEDVGNLSAPAPEWAVRNQQLHLSGLGVFTFTTPPFMAWLPPQVEAEPSARWMRITLSEREWVPFSGVNDTIVPNAGGSGPAGGYQYGETEDYYARCIQSAPNTKWLQLPDLTPDGIDIKVDDTRILADDFECTTPSLLTDVHFWGSWKHDDMGRIENIRLSIHSDDPVGIGGSDKENNFSKPDEQLWECDFGPEEFEESLYRTATDRGEWWWDPAKKELIEDGDKQVWRYDIKIDPDEAFFQRGTEERPTIYWLDIRVTTGDGEFGWKTRQQPDHFMDDAVWDRGSEMPRIWNEMRYPEGHPHHGLERDSIDMAFMLTFKALDWGDAPDPRYPTLLSSNGASHIIDPDVRLGGWVEADEDGQPSISAIGDDIVDGTADEDGVAIPPLRVGATTRIEVFASVDGYLNAWFDWNSDGDWDDEGEYAISEQPIPAGLSLHNIRVPDTSKPGSSYARFRFSTRPLKAVLPEPLYGGRAPDGEVEDYEVQIRLQGYCECGDLNCDGEVTAADAVIALKIAAGSRLFDSAADVSGDGQVTSLDALMILQAAAGTIEIC